MIAFDGVSINSTGNIKVEDIKISPIRYSPIVRPRAIRWGSDFVRMGGGEKTVTITFALLESNNVKRQQDFFNLSEWAKTDKEYRMDIATVPDKHLLCVCTQKPEPSTRAWWESKLRLVFTCFSDPYWRSNEEKTAACGTAFYVLGDAPPLMQITRTIHSAATNQAYSDGTHTMIFSSIPAGDMVIDLNAQTAAVGGSSIMESYTTASEFVQPSAGQMTISGTGTIKYRERWQ